MKTAALLNFKKILNMKLKIIHELLHMSFSPLRKSTKISFPMSIMSNFTFNTMEKNI